MGPLFVLAFWVIVAGALSVLGGLACRVAAAFLLKGVTTGRQRALNAASLLPLACFAYLFLCTVLFSIWSLSRGRDMGWGDSWETPFYGNYRLVMIDVEDTAELRIGKTALVEDVAALQVRPPYIVGRAAKRTDATTEVSTPYFFILDTRNNRVSEESSLNELERKLPQSSLGPLHMQAVSQVYSQTRYVAADYVVLLLFLVPPILAFAYVLRAVIRLRAARFIEVEAQ